MKIRIISPGKFKDFQKPWFNEYLKRCETKIELCEIATEEIGKNEKIERESQKIFGKIKSSSNSVIVLLDSNGRTMTSFDFAKMIEKFQNTAVKTVAFIIGGSYGVSDNVKKAAHYSISFGLNTWPHQLVRVQLIEQIYRAETILSGQSYHH